MEDPAAVALTVAAALEMQAYAPNVTGCYLGRPQLMLGEFRGVEIQARRLF